MCVSIEVAHRARTKDALRGFPARRLQSDFYIHTYMSKASFDEYVGESGAKEALAQAVVGLSKASIKDKSVRPAVFLRDFFTPAPKGDATAQLNKADKEKVTEYMTSSGANDLITKALVSLYESSSRPAKAADFFRDFFTGAAGGSAAPPEPDAPPPEPAAPPPEPAAPPPEPPPGAPVDEKAADPLTTEPPAADAAPTEAAPPDPPPSAPPSESPAAPAEGEAASPPEAPAAEGEAAPPAE